MEDQESCKRALQVQQALGTTAKHEMGSWKPAEQQHLTSNTHTHHFYTVKRLKKKKELFQGWAAMANLVKLNLCHRREDSKGRGYVPYTAGDGAAFMSLD